MQAERNADPFSACPSPSRARGVREHRAIDEPGELLSCARGPLLARCHPLLFLGNDFEQIRWHVEREFVMLPAPGDLIFRVTGHFADEGQVWREILSELVR